MPPIVIDLLFFVAGAIFVAVICFIKKIMRVKLLIHRIKVNLYHGKKLKI